MAIFDLCSIRVITAHPSQTVREAASLMEKHNVGTLLVVDEGNKRNAVGLVTDRDLVTRALATTQDISEITLRDVMSPSVETVRWDQGIRQVILKMQQAGIRRVVVVDSDQRPCGIVSADDLVRLLGDELNLISSLIGQQSLKDKYNLSTTNA